MMRKSLATLGVALLTTWPLLVLASTTITTNNSTVAAVTLNDGAGDGQDCQTFTSTQAGTISTGTFYLQWIGSPTGNITVSLQSTNGSFNPSGTTLGSVVVSNATLVGSTNGRTLTWTFASPVTIANSTLYAMCATDSVSCEGSCNYTTGFQFAGNAGFAYSGGQAQRNSLSNGSGTWDTAGGIDLTWTIQQDDAAAAGYVNGLQWSIQWLW